MPNTISKEMLKSALMDLAKSDQDFFIALLSEALKNAAQNTGTSTRIKGVKQKGGKIPLPAKVNPSYRQEAKALRGQYAISQSDILELRDLFADAPSAETIIETLTK